MFSTVGTAMITPFAKDGSVDEEALRRLVDFQESNGVEFLIPCGSTGESATLSHEEHLKVISIVVDQAKKAKIVAGTGSNCTREAVELSRSAEDLGVDGVLCISPYYVKPTQEGIYQHFKAIAESINVPVILYNVPGRTGSNMEAATSLRLAEIDNITAIKEASGNIPQIERILAERPKGFQVFSGDDGLTYDLMTKSADGVISVVSNCCPADMVNMTMAIKNGRCDEAKEIDTKLREMFTGMFVESNPIPIKYVMQKLGYGNGIPRLPLTPLSEGAKAKLDPILERVGL